MNSHKMISEMCSKFNNDNKLISELTLLSNNYLGFAQATKPQSLAFQLGFQLALLEYMIGMEQKEAIRVITHRLQAKVKEFPDWKLSGHLKQIQTNIKNTDIALQQIVEIYEQIPEKYHFYYELGEWCMITQTVLNLNKKDITLFYIKNNTTFYNLLNAVINEKDDEIPKGVKNALAVIIKKMGLNDFSKIDIKVLKEQIKNVLNVMGH
ncbi:MAG: hypothetical protein OMM_03707 [Candidatus Magnetoglobus multicellularis str. Araruama]|uniref:Uncharacterized protein n=1 Tax=Candidatus Magnetoglobus multicellularis str. Araruama TaxID=890399 RepID=A0A1V1P4W0_9BACT|nr:MAG: hypothetical protein OMM_03707 [Candidatus Magnetoglobus multicellularis str. Araruama]